MEEGTIMSEDMSPYQPKPLVNFDDEMHALANLIGLYTLEMQRLSLTYREAGMVELATFTTDVVSRLDHAAKMLSYVPNEYKRRLRDNSI
jgi:hypothetical protein